MDLNTLSALVTDSAAALRRRTDLQPAGGPGDPIFPATYEKGQYATEVRLIDGAEVPCVLIDSVQSQANRMEEALLDAADRGRLSLPIVAVEFRGPDLVKPFRVTSLDAPHRIADALLRDSMYGGKRFRESEFGKPIDGVGPSRATPLFGLCPTALVFGMWDSTGPSGGLGAKFQRAIVSEITGLHAHPGHRTSSRIDPAQILKGAATLYEARDGHLTDWTLDARLAAVDKDKKPKLFSRSTKADKEKAGSPAKANHGNVTPTIADGGFTISKAVQTTVISLAALRRLRFPLNDDPTSKPDVDDAARTALAALALCGATLGTESGGDLRSRCHLVPTTDFMWEVVDRPGTPTRTFSLTSEQALALYDAAVERARAAGLPWLKDVLRLEPSPELRQLVVLSQKLAAKQDAGEGV